MSSGFTLFEDNLLEECDGDPEVVSVKASDMTVRNNTVRRSQGVLSLRHGDRNSLYGNVVLGEGRPGTGGIRLYGADNRVFNNYVAGTTGTGYDSALSIDGGDARPGGELNKHHRVDNAVVVFNTLVDNATGIVIGENYPEPPVDLVVENNLLADSGDVRQVKPPAGGSLANNTVGTKSALGLTDVRAGLEAGVGQPRDRQGRGPVRLRDHGLRGPAARRREGRRRGRARRLTGGPSTSDTARRRRSSRRAADGRSTRPVPAPRRRIHSVVACRGPTGDDHHGEAAEWEFARPSCPLSWRPPCASRWPVWQRHRIATATSSPHKRKPRPSTTATPQICTTSMPTTTVWRASGCPTNATRTARPRRHHPDEGVETGAGGTADLVTAAEDTADDSSGPLLPLVVGGAVLAAGGLVLVRRRSVGKND